MPNSSQGKVITSQKRSQEMRFKARSVSRGIAIGKVVCLMGDTRQYYLRHIVKDDVEKELRRLRAAIRLCVRQLKKLADPNSSLAFNSASNIFSAHLLILSDQSLLTAIEHRISSELINAEWAVRKTFDDHIARYRVMSDEHFRDKYLDLDDIAERIMTALGGGTQQIGLEPGSVVVARELRPSTVVELRNSGLLALITEHGGWTSHSFILARELGIPAVTGIRRILRKLSTGDLVIVDGFNGQVLVNPEPKTFDEFSSVKTGESVLRTEAPAEIGNGFATTLDGQKIELLANVDVPRGARASLLNGANGIGLFRSEFLFNRFGGFPSEMQQFTAYRKLADQAGKGVVRIRTFDIDVGQKVDRSEDREANPALGLRAIRLGLAYPNDLRIQFRAILRASHERKVDIVLPLVTGISDIEESRSILEKERAEMLEDGIDVGDPSLGVMIEVPSVVLQIDDVLQTVDFALLGTNDLTQYILAADRDNETVSNWYRTLHPAVLKCIKLVTDAGRKHNKAIVACGEMAGSPFYVPVLIGLGIGSLSMNTHSLSNVYRMISGIAYDESVELVKLLLKLRTAEAVEQAVRKTVDTKWAHLLPPDMVVR
ncbi:MAG: phosphoenolpyruvate--protein phosphotransferase [Acidobacteria bacterium]|nr:phosphoenolpyruvate--protein phosphotransferase [Acidobacteriota bacterium]